MIIPQYVQFRSIFGLFAPPDVTGYATWPSALLRADGFNQYLITQPMPAVDAIPTNNGILIVVNGTLAAPVADAVSGVDEFDWYLSQRTDATSLQNWSLTQYTDGSPNTYSGAVVLKKVSGTSSSPPTLEEQFSLCRHCYLYVRERVSPSGASPIQLVDLTRTYFASIA